MAYNKYRAKPTVVDGIRFASKAEAKRYTELKLMEKAGLIKDLELQPKFPIIVDDSLICTYIADFQYHDNEKYELVVEDVKGMETKEFKIKRKLFEVTTGMTLTIVKGK